MVERRAEGMVEWRNGGMVEWRNGGMAGMATGMTVMATYRTYYYILHGIHQCMRRNSTQEGANP